METEQPESTTLRRRIHALLEDPRNTTREALWVRRVLSLLILANIVALFAETHYRGDAVARAAFVAFERVSVAVFTLEHVLRLWACVEQPAFAAPILGRLRYVRSPIVLIDLAAILPFYLGAFGLVDARFLRSFRLFRLVRILKLGRYSESMRTLGRVLYDRRADLASAGFVIFVLLITASALMYYAERHAQPDRFPTMSSALWWGIATMSTIGYGDVVPVTLFGKVLGGVLSLLGIGLFGLPAGILASGFADEMRRKRGAQSCPHCGGTGVLAREPPEGDPLHSIPTDGTFRS